MGLLVRYFTSRLWAANTFLYAVVAAFTTVEKGSDFSNYFCVVADYWISVPF